MNEVFQGRLVRYSISIQIAGGVFQLIKCCEGIAKGQQMTAKKISFWKITALSAFALCSCVAFDKESSHGGIAEYAELRVPGGGIPKGAASHLHDKTRQLLWIAQTKDGVRLLLRDSRSAEFRNVVFHAYQGRTPVVCGQVNARNGFGGYTGFQGFVGAGSDFVFLESEFQAGEFVVAWKELCFR